MESYKRKPNYKKNFLRNRVLKILIHFDIAVLLYIILQFSLGKRYHFGEYMGSLIGWNTVGNSSWFIFDILALYVIFYFSLHIEKWYNSISNSSGGILLSVILSCIMLWLFLYITKGQSRWVNNIMVFPLGISYSMYRNLFEEWLNRRHYYSVFIFLTLALVAWHSIVGIDKVGVCTSLFAIWIVMLTMKVQFGNRVLQWLGTMAFAIFILQRLPMIALTHFGFNQDIWLFVSIVIISTLIISQFYTSFLNKMDNYLFKR